MVDKDILKNAIKEYLIGLVEKKILEVEITQFNVDIHNMIDSINGWILVENEVPMDDRFVLLSFENFTVPQIGRYHADEDGGAFCLGDEEIPLVSYGLFVNAWMELPKCYRED